MRFRLEQKSIDRLIPKKVPQQTAFWGNLKRDMGYETLAFDIYVNTQKKKYHYDFLMIIVPIADNKFMAYIPFAANMFPDNIDYGKSIEAFSEKLRNYLPKKCIFIRHELNWEIPWAYDPSYYDSENNWLGRPEVRLMEMRMNFS
ncbi:MAG: hypothetical protein K9L78_05240, partial [Victivallales bacterium]|nr:hypothetical protein [Victivallales bacterium]